MKIVKKVLMAFGIILLLIGLADILWVFGPPILASRKIEDIDQYAKKVNEISLKEEIKVVALGEASHGNVEFQELRLSLLQDLVEKEGVRSFVLEADFGEGLLINEYIHGGSENLEDVIKNLSFTIYQTKETKDLIQWMREYNEKVEEKDKLSFYGFDMQNPEKGLSLLANFCKENPSLGEQNLQRIMKFFSHEKSENKKDNKEEIIQSLKSIQEQLIKDKDSLTDPQMAQLFSRQITCILNSIEYYDKDMSDYAGMNNIRDKFMADNVKWIQKFEEDKGNPRILIAGHNGHVGYKASFYKPMGAHLKETLGQDYFVIGTDYFKTTSNINAMGRDSGRGNYKFNSADPLAAQAKYFEGMYYLDFNGIREKESTTYEKISKPMSMGSLGEGYSILMKFLPTSHRIKDVPKDLYDGMIFVYEGSPIVPKLD